MKSALLKFVNKIRFIQTHLLGIILFDVLILFVPGFYNSFYLPKLVLLLSSALVLLTLETIYFIKNQRRYLIFISDFWLIFFLFINILATYFSAARSISFWGFYPFEGLNLFFLPSFIIFAWIFKRLTKKAKNYVLLYVFFSIIIASSFVIYKYLRSSILYNERLIRPSGFEGHPVAQGGIIGLGILLTMMVDLDFLPIILRRIVKLIVIIVHLISLIILNSSTVWVSLAVSFTAGIIIKITLLKKKYFPMKFPIFSIVIFSLSLCLIFLINKKQFSIYRRLIETKGVVNMLKGEYISSPYGFKNLVIGHGQNSSGFFYPKYKLPPQINDKEWQVLLTNFHNHFFEIFFTTGVIALLIWLSFFYLAFKNAWEKKNTSYVMILFYLLNWQMLYLLLPSIHAITWILLFLMSDIDKKPFIAINNRVLKLFVIAFILIYCIFTFSNGLNLIRAEIAFNRGDVETAITLAPHNDFYIKSSINKTLDLLVLCKSRKDTQFPECKRTNLDHAIKKAYENGETITSINPYNAESWALFGNVIFKKYLFSNSLNFALRKESLTAGKKALELDPTNPVYADDIGLVYYDIRDYKNAEKYWLIAYKLKPDYHATLNHLRDLNERLGNKEKQDFYNNLLN